MENERGTEMSDRKKVMQFSEEVNEGECHLKQTEHQ